MSKYYLKKKSSNDLEFDEATPFIRDSGEKIFGSSEWIANYSKLTIYIVIFLIGILGLQTFKLQIINRDEFSALAENNRFREVIFHADRGIIYDKNNKILVQNKAIFDLVVIPKEVSVDKEELKKIIGDIAKITNRDIAEIDRNLKKINRASYKQELVLDNLDVASAIAIEAGIEKMPGFEIKNNAIREYPDAKYFSNIIGYTGRVNKNDLDSDEFYETIDFIGKEGLESQYEKYLRGEKGKEIFEIDAKGKNILLFDKIETKTGGNLVLSLDADLQKKLHDLLEETVKKIKVKEKNNGAAAAIAMDPRNGKILAMVSLPSYDNNIFANPENKKKINSVLFDPMSSMMNRVISGTYPPGSTIKPVMGIAALEEGIINSNTIIFDGGVITIPNPFNPDRPSTYYGWDRNGLGPMNLVSAIAQSSDIFFYTIGGGYENFKGLGADKIVEYFLKFNLGEKLGIDLSGESEGLVPTREWKKNKIGENWNLGNTYHISIGQGYLLTTPLQVASWTSVMANRGTIYKPYLVEKVISSKDGSVLKEFNPQAIKENFIEQKYIDNVREGMRETIVSGSAHTLSDLKVNVAGKTGTAQFGTLGQAHAWFTSFAPYDNPEIVLTILIEGGGEGGINAVPIAKDVLNWYFNKKR